jgi:Methyltransferase domain
VRAHRSHQRLLFRSRRQPAGARLLRRHCDRTDPALRAPSFRSRTRGDAGCLRGDGCGRGADVEFFRSLGIDTEGYDPRVPFGFAESPTGLFMVVTLIFVLNVLPTVEDRLEAMRQAIARLAPDGVLIVAARSSAAVRSEAARRGWRAWGDGFVSHEGRGTFQHGMDPDEIVGLGEMLGLRSQWPLPTVRDASLVALARRPPTTRNA